MSEALREYVRTDLRWSYFVIAGLIVLGGVLNLMLAHGWWVWPFVFVAGLMTMIHEAADRNGEGIPPFQGYALFAAVIGLWVIIAVVLTWVGPLVLLGVPPLAYYGTRIYLKNLKRTKLIAERRGEGRCIHCGENTAREYVCCQHCGKDPGLDEGKPVSIGAISNDKKAKAREALTPTARSAAMRQREQTVLRQRRGK